MWLDSFLYRRPSVRQWFSRALPAREVTIQLFGRKFRISIRYEVGLARLAYLLQLSPTAAEAGSLLSLVGLLRPGCTFIDVGANCGLYSVPVASVLDVIGGRVIAIEPNHDTATRLRASLQQYPCAAVIEAAASDACGTRAMVYSSHSSATFRIAESSPRPEFLQIGPTHEVKTIRLDELECAAPVVVKIDVEGHEVAVLRGLRGMLSTGAVYAVMVDGAKDPAIRSTLDQFGYRFFDGRTMQEYHGNYNLLAVHKSVCRRPDGAGARPESDVAGRVGASGRASRSSLTL